MSKVTLRKLSLALGFVVATLSPIGCKNGQTATNATTGNTILVGEYGSLTGPQASFGISTNDAIQLATDQINAKGGIKGKKVIVKVEDDMGQPAQASTDVNRLIDDGAIAILGEVASSCSLAGGRVCQQRHIPMISPSSTNTAVTELGDYIFRVCFIDPFQAAVVARFAHDGLHATRVAIFTNKDQAYSTGFSDNFKKAFTAMGGQIVIEKSYSGNDSDFRGALTAIKQANPQAILIPGYYNDAGSIARQARALGITCPLLGGDGWDSQDLFKTGGSAVNGCYFSDHLSIDDPSPRVQAFVRAFEAKYHHKPDALAALGYDAANLLFNAMERAPSLKPEDIRNAIASTKDFPGVTGNITINAQRNADKPAVIIKVDNGKFRLAATITNPYAPLPPGSVKL